MILAALLLVAGQQTAPVPPGDAPPPDQFSVLWTPCPPPKDAKEVLVCGGPGPKRLPLPEERGPPDHPVPSNPDVSGMGALAAGRTPCAAVQGGCQVGIDLLGMGTALVRLAQKAVSSNSCCEEPGEGTNPGYLVRDAVHGVKAAFRKKPDKSGRVPIDLNAPAPSTQGRVLP